MATLAGDLWRVNFARVRVVDVSDDYRLMRGPLPSAFYPVLSEGWLPLCAIADWPDGVVCEGYLYDWHEAPETSGEPWVVAVAEAALAVSRA